MTHFADTNGGFLRLSIWVILVFRMTPIIAAQTQTGIKLTLKLAAIAFAMYPQTIKTGDSNATRKETQMQFIAAAVSIGIIAFAAYAVADAIRNAR